VRRLVLLVLLAGRIAAADTIGVGDRLPSFSLDGFDGRRISASELAGKPVVIDFWASWCATCRTALPAIDRMARRLVGRDVVVLAVNVDRSRGAADAWLAERLPDHVVTLAHDPEGALLARFGASGMPATYVVDRAGVVRLAEAGYAPERVDAIERAVDAVLAPARD